jgi:hypothetical protein
MRRRELRRRGIVPFVCRRYTIGSAIETSIYTRANLSGRFVLVLVLVIVIES